MSDKNKKSADPASQQMIERAAKESMQTAWDRLEKMQPQCGFGQLGVCCTICNMGPCRIDPFGEGPELGVCGANADTIAARNLARKIAAGAAAHSDHGRGVAHTLLLTAKGEAGGYQLTDINKLKTLAMELGVNINQPNDKIALELAEKCLAEFGKQEGELQFIKRAPKKRQELWRKLGIVPRGIDREVVELIHTTHMGVDNDYKNIIKNGMRTALCDGWGGSMVATELQDILLGSPAPIRSKVNLGVLREDYVNILIHGHEPILSDMAVRASWDPEIKKLAEAAGAMGVNLAGICCTANEVLMRHGVPVAGNFLQQELAIFTGAVEVMMVDIQCIMPALSQTANCFHTKLITTNSRARFPGVEHIEFDEKDAYNIAKRILKIGIENYKRRDKSRVIIPKETMDLVAGFTKEVVYDILGGKYRPSYRPLNDAIISGRIRGVAGVVGCNNPKQMHDYAHLELTKELLKNDVLVMETGCAAIACAKAGMLVPEAASKYAGPGLKEICDAVGIPPVLHLGSCVDNSRILTAASAIIAEGGLGEDLSDLPAAGCAPEWMSEKAITIGFYFVASGVFTIFGTPQPIYGSRNLTEYLTAGLEGIVGGKYAFCDDPIAMARMMIEHIDKKRQALGLKPVMYKKDSDEYCE
ncbi:MAG: anaerobic carbon-monoxide dehydrogenase catalytic subunit [Candidatus Omnitrophota bacterium]